MEQHRQTITKEQPMKCQKCKETAWTVSEAACSLAIDQNAITLIDTSDRLLACECNNCGHSQIAKLSTSGNVVRA